MNFPGKVMVTDQEIDLSQFSDAQKQYFLNLAEKIKNLYLNSGKNRYVISISGPSGSGKSVLSILLQELLKSNPDFTFYPVDLDAFHFKNKYLAEHNLIEVKGRFDTYDVESISSALRSFKNGEEVQFPKYSRKEHEPQENGPYVTEEKALIFLAGLWIERDDEVWRQVRENVDYSFVISGEESNFEKNTVTRHVRGGRSKEDALLFYKSSDAQNTKEILSNSVSCDEVIPYYEDI